MFEGMPVVNLCEAECIVRRDAKAERLPEEGDVNADPLLGRVSGALEGMPVRNLCKDGRLACSRERLCRTIARTVPSHVRRDVTAKPCKDVRLACLSCQCRTADGRQVRTNADAELL